MLFNLCEFHEEGGFIRVVREQKAVDCVSEGRFENFIDNLSFERVESREGG